MLIVRVCCTLFLFLCLINYMVDFLFCLKQRYCRYHIGCWEREEWEYAIEKRAICWLKKTPVVKITDNSRYILLDFLRGKYKSNTIQSWQKAALMIGLYETRKENDIKAVRNVVEKLLDTSGNWRTKPDRVDCGMLSYAILRVTEDSKTVKMAMDYSISVIIKSINNEGLISYTGNNDDPDIYIDTIGLCCPFLACYSRVYKQAGYEKIAFQQIKKYHQYGMLKDTALPNHAFNKDNKLPLGVYGWGRGIGWYALGLLDCYEEMETEKYKAILKEWICEAAEEYRFFQHEDGGFCSIIQRTSGYDSSATAVLAWFYLKCSLLFMREDYYKIAERSLKKLMKSTRINGAIDWCQGDTKGIGIFSQTYDIMPFAQGMAIRAINLREEYLAKYSL